MSSSDKPEPGTSATDTKSGARNIPTQQQHDDLPSSTPVEMNSLKTDNTMGVPAEQQGTRKSIENAQMPHLPMRTDTSTAILASQFTLSSPPPVPSPSSPRSNRAQSTAIGESTDSPVPLPKDTDNAGPTLMITLLLINGARHPFNLDAKYLSKRNVTAQGNDPFNLSVYKLKELILREWREEWELKPSSPSAIRLIHFGKVLDDKTPVKGMLTPTDELIYSAD